MQRKLKENIFYVLEEELFRFAKPVGVLYLAVLGVLVFQFVLSSLNAEPAAGSLGTAAAEIGVAGEKEEIREARIEIQKIGAQAPIVFVGSTDPDDFVEPLQKGVTHYPSPLPGEKGAAIILGHSAPFGWLGNGYDGVFSRLNELEKGDKISVLVNETIPHVYEVQKSFFLRSGEEIPEEALGNETAKLLLISCWPPGIDNKRIVVQAEYADT